jgi:hypothetical protein
MLSPKCISIYPHIIMYHLIRFWALKELVREEGGGEKEMLDKKCSPPMCMYCMLVLGFVCFLCVGLYGGHHHHYRTTLLLNYQPTSETDGHRRPREGRSDEGEKHNARVSPHIL